MAINLLETVQQNLQYPPLKKIDPNTQEVKEPEKPEEHQFSQAAIPAVLVGLHTYTGKDEGAEAVLRGNVSSSWVTEIFGDTKEDVVQKVASYSNSAYDQTLTEMDMIAGEAVKVIRDEVKPAGTVMDVKNFISSQTTNILKFLPEALKMGKVLSEETLDDNTNKMEGPISSLMHKIGSAFSNPSNEAEVTTKQ